MSTPPTIENTNLQFMTQSQPKSAVPLNNVSATGNLFKLHDPVDPVDIGIKILVEEDEDGVITRCFTEQKQRYYTDFATAHQLLEAQETPVVQIHFTYMQPLVAMSQDIFLSANINHMELDVELDIDEADKYIIGYCFITQDDKLYFLTKQQAAHIFKAKPEDGNIYNYNSLLAIRQQLIGRDWSPVLANTPVIDDDPDIVITKDRLGTILDKRNGAIRSTAVQAPQDLSILLNDYMTASTMFHVSKIDKERQINNVIQRGKAEVLDHTNLDGGWALVHQDCIGYPKWDIKPYPKQADWDDIEKRYKELRNKLRVAQIRHLDLLKYADGTHFRNITTDHRYHVIFTGLLYNDPLSLKNFAVEHIKFIQMILAQPNMGIGITNLDVSVSRLYDRLTYDKMSKTEYYVQNPVVYGWHGQLSRVAKIHSQDLVSINNTLSYNPDANETKPSGGININRCVRSTVFIVWFK
jgi:hypothetical protein